MQMMRLSYLLPLISLASVTVPANAAQYLEVHLQTYAQVDVPIGDGATPPFTEAEVFNTSFDAVLDVDDLTTGYYPDIPGSLASGFYLDTLGFHAFTLQVAGEAALYFGYNIPLNGLDVGSSFSKIFRNVGSYSADYAYSRYELVATVRGPIAFASVRSFSGDNIANSVSFDQHWYSVPEPATWAMMLIGFGTIGAATRYRRNALLRLA